MAQRQNLLSSASFKAEVEEKFLGPQLAFRPYYGREFEERRKRLGLLPPKGRHSPYRERGYIFSSNGYDVIVWTSYVEALGRCRDRDQIHVVIACEDRMLYKTREIRRTTDFVRRMLSYAWIAREKVLCRPLCPHCGLRMDLKNGKFRRYWWSCGNLAAHSTNTWENLDWDFCLIDKPAALAFLEEMRKPGRKYRDRLKKQGKEPWKRIKSHIGKGWRITKRQNMYPRAPLAMAS